MNLTSCLQISKQRIFGRFASVVGIFLALVGGIQGGVADADGLPIGVTLNISYVSQYIWRGYDLLDDHGAWQPEVTLDYEGFYVGVWGSWADRSGFVDSDELDYYVGYDRSFFEEEQYALDASILYTYIDYPKSDSVSGLDEVADCQELMLRLAMPSLLPIGESAIGPFYEACYEWDGVQNRRDVDDGWIHTFGLAYDLPIPALIPDQEEQYLSWIWDITYNDGTFGSESGWSHSTIGVSTSFEFYGFALTPAAAYQWSFEDTVNDEDEFYGSIGLSYSF